MNEGLAPLMLLGAVAVFAVVWLILAVNGLKQLALLCDEAWSDVVHDLGRRHELVPQLVEIARPLLSEHAELLDGMLAAIEEARKHRAAPGELGLDESAVSVTLQRLLVLVEQRPTLKQDEAFQNLRRELVEIEERIQRSRRTYNTNAKDLNRRGQTFPVSLFAGTAAASRRDVFELLPVGLATPSGKSPL